MVAQRVCQTFRVHFVYEKRTNHMYGRGGEVKFEADDFDATAVELNTVSIGDDVEAVVARGRPVVVEWETGAYDGETDAGDCEPDNCDGKPVRLHMTTAGTEVRPASGDGTPATPIE